MDVSDLNMILRVEVVAPGKLMNVLAGNALRSAVHGMLLVVQADAGRFQVARRAGTDKPGLLRSAYWSINVKYV